MRILDRLKSTLSLSLIYLSYFKTLQLVHNWAAVNKRYLHQLMLVHWWLVIIVLYVSSVIFPYPFYCWVTFWEGTYNMDRCIRHEINTLHIYGNILSQDYNFQYLNPFLYICCDKAKWNIIKNNLNILKVLYYLAVRGVSPYYYRWLSIKDAWTCVWVRSGLFK